MKPSKILNLQWEGGLLLVGLGRRGKQAAQVSKVQVACSHGTNVAESSPGTKTKKMRAALEDHLAQ